MSEGELKGLRDMAAHFKAKEPMGPLGNILDACVAEIERLRSAAPADDALKAAWDKAIESAAKECEQQAEVDENAPYTSAEGVAKGKLCAFTLRSIADEIRELKYEPTAQSRPDSVTEMRAALEDILAKSKDNWAAARAERGLGRGKVGVLSHASDDGRKDGKNG